MIQILFWKRGQHWTRKFIKIRFHIRIAEKKRKGDLW